MKYITFAVPCYNSENYMRRCVDSLLIGGKDVEIILIDDGSSDRTAQIADEYEIEYPDIVRVVHKENEEKILKYLWLHLSEKEDVSFPTFPLL